jgi:hypothetical protein
LNQVFLEEREAKAATGSTMNSGVINLVLVAIALERMLVAIFILSVSRGSGRV